MTVTRPYRPIACSLHDELQLRALRGTPVSVRVRGPGDGGEEEVCHGRITDLTSRDGAEYLVMESGRRFRLDQLLEVDGIAFGDAC